LRGRRLQAPNGSDLFGNPVEGARRLAGSTSSANSSSFVGPVDFKEVLTGLDLKKYWNYDGSFTTPPCTEAVDWYVLMAKATVSQAQLNKFRSAMGWTQANGNFRKPQPVSGRTLYGCSKLPSVESKYPWYPYQTEHWGTDVYKSNSICKHGTFQSPINFAQCLVPALRTAPEISWAKQPVTLVNNGHAVQITAGNSGANRGKMVINRKTYTLIQCHWHWSSEHKVGEKQYPLEVHCVHQQDGTEEAPLYGVFGMFYEVSDTPNQFLTMIEDQLPQHSHRRLEASQEAQQRADGFDLFGHPMDSATGRRTAAGTTVSAFSGPLNFKDLYNGVDLDHFWNYEGSFTTPPCTEAVEFYIMMDPAPVSQAQLDKFKSAIGWTNAGGNFRPPQPLAGRTVAGCRTVGSSSSLATAPTIKSAQCPDQTAALILQAVTAVLSVLILAAICLGPVRRSLTNPVSSSARQVKITDTVPVQVDQLKEDLKFFELNMGTLRDSDETNGREIAKMQELVRQIRSDVLQAHGGSPFWHHAEFSR
jgi:carbonic anhydrase